MRVFQIQFRGKNRDRFRTEAINTCLESFKRRRAFCESYFTKQHASVISCVCGGALII